MKLPIYKQQEPKVSNDASPSWLEEKIRESRHLIENEFANTQEFIQQRVDDIIEFERETVIKAGDLKTFPKKGQQVTMHYTGRFKSNGQKFDSSLDRGREFVTKIGVGQVIRGWDEGVVLMSLGEKALLDITYDYAYGERGHSSVIPPKADLVFEVELLKID